MQPFARLSRLYPALLLLSPCWFGEAQAKDDDFEQFRQQQQQAFEAFRDEFNGQYQTFVAAERAAFEQFKAAVEQRWDHCHLSARPRSFRKTGRALPTFQRQYAQQSLSYTETRAYLVKVVDHMALYEAWR